MIKNAKQTASKLSVLGQLRNLIPPHLVCKLSRETGVHSMARSFSPWSHFVSMLFAQLTHAIGLNDVCDALRLHSGPGFVLAESAKAVDSIRAPEVCAGVKPGEIVIFVNNWLF